MLRESFRTMCAFVVTSLVAQCASAAITYNEIYPLGIPSGLAAANPAISNSQAVGGDQLTGIGFTTGGAQHAVYWSLANPSGVDLTPATSYTSARAAATDGLAQVGTGTYSGGRDALLWTGSAASMTNLTPSGFTIAQAFGVSGSAGVQVGLGRSTTLTSNQTHALMWTGTASSYVDLNPSGSTSSTAFGVTADGAYQFGFSTASQHATFWHSTAASAVDLHPAGYTNSIAYCGTSAQQVGYGNLGGQRAMLWNGTASSFVDLHPATGFTSSIAYDTDGNYQVGYGLDATARAHALLWNGSAASVIDLNTFLPASYVNAFAQRIAGDTIYGYAQDSGGIFHAVTWSNVPEPTILTSASLVFAGMVRRRRAHIA